MAKRKKVVHTSVFLDELYKRVSGSVSISKSNLNIILKQVFSLIKTMVKDGNRLSFTTFGSFEAKHFKETSGYNPVTKDKIIIPARRMTRFNPSESWKKLPVK